MDFEKNWSFRWCIQTYYNIHSKNLEENKDFKEVTKSFKFVTFLEGKYIKMIFEDLDTLLILE